MPFLLVIIGLTLIVSSAKNRQGDLFNLVSQDFTGPNNFVFWFVSIIIIGSLGYIKPLKPISNAFMALVVLVLLLSEKGFFSSFTAQISSLTGVQPQDYSNVQNAGVIASLGGGGSSSTTIIPTGPVSGPGPIIGTPSGPTQGTNGCPSGFEWCDNFCVPAGSCSGGGGGDPTDPFGYDPFQNSDLLRGIQTHV
jgi:hypothetical protein